MKCCDCDRDLTNEKDIVVFRDHYTHEITRYQCKDCEWIDEEDWYK